MNRAQAADARSAVQCSLRVGLLTKHSQKEKHATFGYALPSLHSNQKAKQEALSLFSKEAHEMSDGRRASWRRHMQAIAKQL